MGWKLGSRGPASDALLACPTRPFRLAAPPLLLNRSAVHVSLATHPTNTMNAAHATPDAYPYPIVCGIDPAPSNFEPLARIQGFPSKCMCNTMS